MQFGVLGSVWLHVDGGPVDLGPARQRCLLGLLLLEQGVPVSTDRLVDLLWDDPLPARPRSALQVYVSRLRGKLSAAGALDRGVQLQTRAQGYLLATDPATVDVHEVRRLHRLALATSDPARRLLLAREVLDKLRGPPLGSAASAAVRQQIWPAFEELRVSVERLRLGAELSLGRPEHVLGDLAVLTGQHPLDEELAALHLLGLYRAGRRAEALDAYARLRHRLADELGLDPGAALQRLHTGMLRDDPELHRSELEPPADPAWAQPGDRPVAPAMLPPAVSDFVGRVDILTAISALGAEPGSAPQVAVLTGPPGVGKTTVGVRAATDLRRRFPDGQLYADLAGTARAGAPATPGSHAVVLGRFLRALGHPAAAIPTDPDERGDLYRSLVADRRVLVLLDDAADEAAVRPLLPTGRGSLVLVTSRHRLSGLDAAQVIDVAPMSAPEAERFLIRVIGDRRTAKDRAAVTRIAASTAGLPLALRVAGARLAASPRISLAGFASELADEGRRLDLLQAGDRAVRSSFAVSYHALDPPAQEAFRRVGLVNLPEFPSWLAGALLDAPEPTAAGALRRLEEAGVLHVVGTDPAGRARYGMHALMRVFAREMAETTDVAADRPAVERVVMAVLGLTERADRRGGESFLPAVHDAQPCPLPRHVDEAALGPDPLDWMEAERATIVAAVELAVAAGWTTRAWHLAAAMAASCEIRMHLEEWRATHDTALAACKQAGDRLGEAVLLKGLAELELIRDRYDISLQLLEESTRGFRGVGVPQGEADNLATAAVCHRMVGRLDAAEAAAGGAVQLSERIAYPAGRLAGSYQQGIVARELGQADQAVEHLRNARLLAVEARRPRAEAVVLRGLGALYQRTGHLDQAVRSLEQARRTFSDLHDAFREALAARELAEVYMRQGRIEEAAQLLDECDRSFSGRGDRFALALTTGSRAMLAARQGLTVDAEALYRTAADRHRSLRLPLWEARMLKDLGTLLADTGDAARAAPIWRRSRELFLQLGLPDARLVADLLDALPG